MRYSEYFARFSAASANVKFTSHFQVERTQLGTTYSIVRLPEFRDKLSVFLDLPVVNDKAESLYTSQALRYLHNTVEVEFSEYSRLQVLASELDTQILAIIRFLKSQLGDDSASNIVCIKLPQADQMAAVGLALERLDKVLSQALSVLDDNDHAKVRRWENGSLWVEIAFGCAASVFFIGCLAWSAACVYRKYQEGRLLEKLVDSLGIKNKLMSNVGENIDAALTVIVEAEAKRLDEKHSKSKGDPQTIKRLQFCITEMFEMMKVGTEIHPALLAPENIKNVFPNLDETLGLPSAQKLLTEFGDAPQNGGEMKTD